MQIFLDVFLTSWIDPFLWFKSMSTLGVRRSKKQCILIFSIYCCLIDAKGIGERYNEDGIVRECAMFLILFYGIWATWLLFEGTFHKKIIYMFVFFCILLVTELSIVGIYSLFYPKDIDGVLLNNTSNTIFGFLAKILQGLLCYCFFGRHKRINFFCQNRERLSLILMCYIMLSNLYLKRTVYKESPNTTLVLESVFLFWYILSSVLVLREKNKDIWKLKKKVDSGGNTKRQVRDIDQLRHDFSTNVFLMKNLLYYKDYDKLQHFMDTIFADVEKVRLVFDHPNFPVRIVISYLMQIAARAGIPFLIHIETNEFGMTDEDICIVLYNLVVYGLELASVISVREENVQLKVWHNQKGYAILCRCLCTKEEKLRQIDRRQEGSTIFGKELVVRIVKKYGGTMEIGSEKSKWKNIYVKNINIYIPCN
ncbi:MAG TPA: hypothetical protein DCW90_14370 [Lachnospiraceae bacterium]|nr:hypothetical protein [Lachnospiraceae bacterium]